MADDSDRKETGRLGEKIAAEFLVRRGFQIVASNFRKAWGEIDIIALKGNVVRFVEVKTLTQNNHSNVSRENNRFHPEEQVHPWKLKKIARTAETYMIHTKDDREYQIDVVAIFLDKSNRIAHCRLYEQVL
jgi:putative endonuclease